MGRERSDVGAVVAWVLIVCACAAFWTGVCVLILWLTGAEF